MVREAFERTGLDVAEEPFTYDLAAAWAALRTVLVVSGALVAGAGFTLPVRPLLAAGLLLAAIVPTAVFLAWAPGLERLYRREGKTHTADPPVVEKILRHLAARRDSAPGRGPSDAACDRASLSIATTASASETPCTVKSVVGRSLRCPLS